MSDDALAVVLAEWNAALGEDAAISEHTEFFDAGGDSLAAAQIASGIAEALGLSEEDEGVLVEGMFDGWSPARIVEAIAELTG